MEKNHTGRLYKISHILTGIFIIGLLQHLSGMWTATKNPTFYWDPGGIWWDSGEIWTGIPVGFGLGSRWDLDWDPGGIWTGIPVGFGLGSRWDMVGFGLGSRWMWTGIPTKNPSGIEGGIPVGSQSGSQFYFHWGLYYIKETSLCQTDYME